MGKLKKRRQLFNFKTSTLDQYAVNNDDILVTGLAKDKYLIMIGVKEKETKAKVSLVAKHCSNPLLAQFVQQTEDRKMGKLKQQTIDLTEDMDTESIEILNDEMHRDKMKNVRQRAHDKSNRQLQDDLYSAQKFAEDYNPKAYTNQIIEEIIRIENERKEKERKRKEEEQERIRVKKEEERKALQLQNEMEIEEESKDEEKERIDAKMCTLSEKETMLIEQMLEADLSHKVASHKGQSLDVTVKDLCTLEDGQWLNDEVMNFYMALLQDRNNQRSDSERIRVLLMNTFFFTKLSSNSYNYKAVKRWTKQIKLKKKGVTNVNTIFELDKFIFPVHVNKIHWCCGCINFKQKKFEYFDSMNGSSTSFFRTIRKYLSDEHKDKLKGDMGKYMLDLNEWTNDDHKSSYPQQNNGVDCGVFTSKCADWISDDLYPNYSQNDMSYFRKRMIVEIIRGKTQDC